MFEFLFGALAVAVLYTFFPALAVTPSNWLRNAWAWIRSRKPDPSDEAGA